MHHLTLTVLPNNSLGGCCTPYTLYAEALSRCVTQPVTTTRHGLDEAERHRRGISDSMIRLSVGLESVHDLLADIEQALS